MGVDIFLGKNIFFIMDSSLEGGYVAVYTKLIKKSTKFFTHLSHL